MRHANSINVWAELVDRCTLRDVENVFRNFSGRNIQKVTQSLKSDENVSNYPPSFKYSF